MSEGVKMKDKVKENELKDYMWCFIAITAILFFFLGSMMMNVGGQTVVQDEMLNEVCQRLYGEEYYFVDSKFGSEIELKCERPQIMSDDPEFLINKIN